MCNDLEVVADAYLPENRACAEGGQHSALVVRYHAESPALHDVHLLANVSLAADVVSRAEHLRTPTR